MLLHPDADQVLISARRLRSRVRAIAAQISADYGEEGVHLVTVLKGGVFFLTDLARNLTIPNSMDFMAVSSYGRHVESGEVRITKDLDESIQGRHVVIVEDIVDTGLTLAYLCRNLERRGPLSLKVAVLLDRPKRRIADVPIGYKGFDIPDLFVVGYGLDWRQQYRNLPYIGILRSEALTAR
ncbi:MAG: hypoxanthine phosphoribosyltransferase [Fimbriimonadia bacterium]|jgi:hypoxanthine phosphoribosyltransferase